MISTYLKDGSDLQEKLRKFCSSSQSDSNVANLVSEILSDIREGGDESVIKRTLLYDGVQLNVNNLRVSREELELAKGELSSDEKACILDAIKNVTLFHENSLPENWSVENIHGAKVGEKYYPINRVGIYVPGGNVPLVSTVIMTVTIAKVANVKEIAVVTPPDTDGRIAPQMLAA